MNSLIILIISLKLTICSKLIKIPLILQFTKVNYNLYSYYNASHFLNDNYKKEITLEINIGTPSQKIKAYINPDSYCFQFKISKINSSYNYYPHKSTSFNTDKIQSLKNKYIISNDAFIFNKNETYILPFVSLEELNISSNMNISLIAEIGLNNPATYMGHNLHTCNSFISGLKNMKAINTRIFSIKYYNKYSLILF